MLRTLIFFLFCIISCAAFANEISFCVNDDEIHNKNLYFALDADVFVTSYTSRNCFHHDTKGTSLVLFTNGFDVTYQSTKCGNADPCIIPLNLNDGRSLSSFIIDSKVLIPRYN